MLKKKIEKELIRLVGWFYLGQVYLLVCFYYCCWEQGSIFKYINCMYNKIKIKWIIVSYKYKLKFERERIVGDFLFKFLCEIVFVK